MKVEDISVVIATQNDSSMLDRCLGSVDGFGEVIIVDAFSTDKTVQVARSHRAIVFSRRTCGAADQKNWALDRARHRWVLTLDVVDVLSGELRRAIESLEETPASAGYAVRRVNHYLGGRIRYCGWGSDERVQLFERLRGRFRPGGIGEDSGTSIEIDGEISAIRGELNRFPYETIEDHLDAIEITSGRRAQRYVEGGGGWPVLGMVLRPPFNFLNNYVLRRGFLDGRRGFVFCLIASYGVFLEFAKTWEILWKRTNG